jgi:Fumarylacetoacetate (FAA) hydrolase family
MVQLVASTGTPPGVGLGQKPPVYLNVGDTVTLGIARLGTQRQVVSDFQSIQNAITAAATDETNTLALENDDPIQRLRHDFRHRQ